MREIECACLAHLTTMAHIILEILTPLRIAHLIALLRIVFLAEVEKELWINIILSMAKKRLRNRNKTKGDSPNFNLTSITLCSHPHHSIDELFYSSPFTIIEGEPFCPAYLKTVNTFDDYSYWYDTGYDPTVNSD